MVECPTSILKGRELFLHYLQVLSFREALEVGLQYVLPRYDHSIWEEEKICPVQSELCLWSDHD